jgi:hypothetical protein
MYPGGHVMAEKDKSWSHLIVSFRNYLTNRRINHLTKSRRINELTKTEEDF